MTDSVSLEDAPRRGLHVFYLGLEIKRVVTNVSTLVFCCAMPVGFYLLFGLAYGADPAGNGNTNAVTLAMMAVYGAAMTATAPAYALPRERASGWSRQLRLSPLRPITYVTAKVIASLIAALACLLILYLVGFVLRQARMPLSSWFATMGVAWIGAIGFSAMGLFIGLVMDKGEPAAVIVPIMMVCSFLAGVFQIPLQGKAWDIVRNIVPMGGLSRWSESFFGSDVGTTDWMVWTNIVGWALVFVIIAALAFSRDTKRV